MISAFGVDHGAVSKAMSPSQMADALKAQHAPHLARKAAKKLSGAQVRTQGTNPGATTRPQHIKNFLNRIGEADISIKGVGRSAGKGVKHTGRFVERHPGLSGTALVGGGGYAGYRTLSNREPPKKRRTA
jgi:hypothetical protein